MRVLLTLALLAPVAAGAAVVCESSRGFHDGDTFACVPANGEPFVVRVAGLDAPETGQGYWRVARDRLRELAAPGTTVDCYKSDRYGRQVCRVRTPAGADAVEQLLTEGLAWHAVRYADEQSADERRRYAAAEAAARTARRGLWAEPSPQEPHECRREREQRRRCR